MLCQPEKKDDEQSDSKNIIFNSGERIESGAGQVSPPEIC
jgi:hypothetical protein